MSEKIELLIEATDNASSVLGNVGQSLGNIGRIAGGLALGGVAAMGAGLLKLGSDGLSLNNSMEKVTAQLNAFTKDGAKTADIIETVRTRAAKTPFEFDAMAKAAVALFPASKTAQGGLEGILEKAEILAASNPAEGLEGAAFALKEAVSGDFTSIIERFNLPRQYINDLKKEGVPNLEIVKRAMQEMGLDVDLVSNLANTAEGRWSTFKDTLAGVAAQATKPIFDAMSGGIAQVNTYLEANAPLLNDIGATIAGTLTTAIQGLTTYLPMVIAGFQQFGATISTMMNAVASAGASFNLIGAQIALAMLNVQPALDGILQAVTSIFGSLIPIALASGMGAWTLISTTMQAAIGSAISIVQTWLPVVQAALGGVALFLQAHGAEIQLLISTAWNAITTIIQTAITTATTIINALAPVVNEIFGAISTFLNAHGSEILGFLTGAWNSIREIVSGVAAIVQKVVTDVFGAVTAFLRTHGDDIQRVLTGAWTLIKTVIGETLSIIKAVVSTALAIINGDWATAWKGIEAITQSSNNIIKTVIDTAMRLIESVITLAVDGFKRGWEMGWQLMQTATANAMTLIKEAINTGIETAKTVITNGVEAFLGKFRDLRDKMSVIGQQLLEGMVQGIRDKVGWLVDEGVRAANAVLTAIKSTLGIKSPSVEGKETSAYLIEGLVLGITDNADDWIMAGEKSAHDVIERIRVTLEPLPDMVHQIAAQTTTQFLSPFSGLADGVEDQLLTVSESFVELAQTGDTTSLNFAQSFDAIKKKFAELVPSFKDVQGNFDTLYRSMASGQFDVESYWKAWERMMIEIKGSVSQTMPVVAQVIGSATKDIGLSTRWVAEQMEDQILTAAESFVELSQTGDTTSLNFVQAFEAIKKKIGELVPAFGGGQTAMQAMHAAMASGQFNVEAYWQAYDQLLQEIKLSMTTSQDVVTTTTQAMTNAVVSATQTMQTQASAAAQSIAASMIAAGEVINTTQSQLANFIQSGGVGGIIGGTYTPSQAFQDSFRNQPVAATIAPPRPSSVQKPSVTNNTPINITINGDIDRYAVEDGVTTALRRSGLSGRFA